MSSLTRAGARGPLFTAEKGRASESPSKGPGALHWWKHRLGGREAGAQCKGNESHGDERSSGQVVGKRPESVRVVRRQEDRVPPTAPQQLHVLGSHAAPPTATPQRTPPPPPPLTAWKKRSPPPPPPRGAPPHTPQPCPLGPRAILLSRSSCRYTARTPQERRHGQRGAAARRGRRRARKTGLRPRSYLSVKSDLCSSPSPCASPSGWKYPMSCSARYVPLRRPLQHAHAHGEQTPPKHS